jgi:uncharacterized repeat protein (TIGR03803 family)
MRNVPVNHKYALRSALGATLLIGTAGAAYPWPAWLKTGILKAAGITYYYGATYETLYSFNPANVLSGEGLFPLAGLAPTASGLLLGTTSAPARAYAVIPPAEGSTKWTETPVAQLGTGTSTPLTVVSPTEALGTELAGIGSGDIYELTTKGSNITKTILYSFPGGAGGNAPISGVTVSPDGTIYGTATGGTGGGGIVYSLAINKKGFLQETVLASFALLGAGGYNPSGELIFGKTDRVLYGTTTLGGAYGAGTVFSLTKHGVQHTLYSFAGGADGAAPGGLVTANGKEFYGATSLGGNGQGTIFSITPGGAYKSLYTFANTADGHTPNPQLALDSSGAIYGTAQGGGYGLGTAWVLAPGATKHKPWHLEVMYNFGGAANDGVQPAGQLILDTQGNVYGVTTLGGAYGAGAVYKITP